MEGRSGRDRWNEQFDALSPRLGPGRSRPAGCHASGCCCGLALFLAELSGGGAERVMVTLANGFAECGRFVDLVLANRAGPYVDEVAAGVRVVDLRAGGSLKALPGLVQYLRRERPSALLTTLHHTGIIALMAKRIAGSDVRIYLREANTLSAMRPASLRGKALRAAAKYSYTFADGVIAVSRGVADDLRRNVPATTGKLETIFNPVVGPELLRRGQESIDHPWFGDPALKVVLAAGRLTAQKDFATLIKAFAALEGVGLRLVILGEGEEREGLQKLIASLGLTGRVDMPGFVRNPFAYMSQASLFVLSSRWEGMPGVLIQAMACGCQVVSTDCPSGPAEVLRGGELGELVPVGDIDALAAAIERGLAAPIDREILSEAASEFSEEASIDAYLRLLLPPDHYCDA